MSAAAEKLHISQPTITRTMQHLEEAFGVSLFVRGKNKISLNDTGEHAVVHARHLLLNAENVLRTVREFDRNRRTITVSSCAPAPLWSALPALATAYPDMTIASSLKKIPVILDEIRSDTCQIAILPEECILEHHLCIPFLKENLSVCVPKSHALAEKSSVTFADMNGFNFLLRSEIGFWDEMCRVQMPASRFFVQTDEYAFIELIRESALPFFTTNLAANIVGFVQNRVEIPVSNPEAMVTYYLICHMDHEEYAKILCH